jgi:hypothetical protein
MRVGVRIALALTALAFVLAGCAARDPAVMSNDTIRAGNWRIETQNDRITGAPLESALLTAPSSHSGEAFPKKATLQLACFNKKPLVRFAFEVKVATTRSNEFGYRFDDRPGHQIAAGFLGDDKVAVIESAAEIAQFLNEMADSKMLYVRIRSLGFGRTTAELNVEGARAAITATTAHCPPMIEEPKPARKPRR